jgi:hypothetical protein
MRHVGEAGSIQGLQAEGFKCTCSKPFQEFLVPVVLPSVVQWLRGEGGCRARLCCTVLVHEHAMTGDM